MREKMFVGDSYPGHSIVFCAFPGQCGSQHAAKLRRLAACSLAAKSALDEAHVDLDLQGAHACNDLRQ